jgi:spore coat protein CotF
MPINTKNNGANSKTGNINTKTCAGTGVKNADSKSGAWTNASGKGNSTDSKTEFAQDMTQLDDVAIISDVLSCQKSLVKLYGAALCEVSCDKLRKLVNNQLSECADDQYDAFQYMTQRNQYPTEPAPSQKVCEAKQKFECKKQQMTK